MVGRLGQGFKLRLYGSARHALVGFENGGPFLDRRLDGGEPLGRAFPAQFAPTGRAQIADPLRLATRRDQIAGAVVLDRDDRDHTLLASLAAWDSECDSSA